MPDALACFHPDTANWFRAALGEPTPVQAEGWPLIRQGRHTLLSAPTGSGKTLAAFLVFIDQMKEQARRGELKDELQLIYISPLKALAGDIRENLRRPLDGIGGPEIRVFVRTGDTPPAERQRMLRRPPHILITTPESLFLLLSSRGGRRVLSTARAVIVDELHALLNTKRGAHLFLSLSRLDALCGRRLQRVGLSATVKPLELAARALAWPDAAAIVAPPQSKRATMSVVCPVEDLRVLPGKSVWPEIAAQVVKHCERCRTVLVFLEGRAQSEKLAGEINRLAGEGFARTHHACVSKEQRQEAEQQLREGKLRVLCATSSMELGIDVGQVDLVCQVGCPSSVSGALQRLGRAGHTPDRESVMFVYPKTAADALFSGLTASLAMEGAIEESRPPMLCLDVLAQQLCSMAVDAAWSEEEALAVVKSAYNFKDVTLEQLRAVLRMLAGDFEHERDKPVRPRLDYDRVHGRFSGDNYTRLLAVSAGGTIPDRGWYAVTLPDGTRLGELDEEFVFEARLGDRFLLGAFAWRLKEVLHDRVIVEPCSTQGAQIPFWRGDGRGRSFGTALRFGRMLRSLQDEKDLDKGLQAFRMDENAARNAARVLRRQKELCGCLPDDRTIVVEHFSDEAGEHQLMVHSLFGARVNRCLEMLLRRKAEQLTGLEVRAYAEDEGVLLMALGEKDLPDGLLSRLDVESAPALVRALLPETPLFSMCFRYAAARALLFGARSGGRQPLWVQRLRGADLLSMAAREPEHPLMQEALRECLQDQLDLSGLDAVLRGLRDGSIRVAEMRLGAPSPLSLPLRRQAEADLMYEYAPTPKAARRAVEQALSAVEGLRPEGETLSAPERRAPETPERLHALLMTEGDLLSEEIDAPISFLTSLAEAGRAAYVEPGLWVAAEEKPLYERAFLEGDREALSRILRRCLRFRGGQDAASLSSRYFLPEEKAAELLKGLAAAGDAVELDGVYHHKDLYALAQRRTLSLRRQAVRTRPGAAYCAYLASRIRSAGSPASQLREALSRLQGLALPPRLWESVVLPARCRGYRPALLDALLASGEFFWALEPGEKPLLAFWPAARLDDAAAPPEKGLTGDELALFRLLRRRGASFASALSQAVEGRSPLNALLALTERGLVRADSFAPVRRILQAQEETRLPAKRRARARAETLIAGRWELAWGVKPLSLEEALLERLHRYGILCRETAAPLPWGEALDLLRVWEFTGRVRRGYFVRGLSGAQFVLSEDLGTLTARLEAPAPDALWLNAADPFQAWGRFLPHEAGRSFLLVPGSAVCLIEGRAAAVLERQGERLRMLEPEKADAALSSLTEAFRAGTLFPELDFLRCRQVEGADEDALRRAGFRREALDFILWKEG